MGIFRGWKKGTDTFISTGLQLEMKIVLQVDRGGECAAVGMYPMPLEQHSSERLMITTPTKMPTWHIRAPGFKSIVLASDSSFCYSDLGIRGDGSGRQCERPRLSS